MYNKAIYFNRRYVVQQNNIKNILTGQMYNKENILTEDMYNKAVVTIYEYNAELK